MAERSVMLGGMKRWLVAALVAAGCYRSSPPPAEPEPPRPVVQESASSHAKFRASRPPVRERSVIAEALVKLEVFADEMCACTDRTCADAVSQELTRWSSDLKDEGLHLEPTEDEMKEATRISEKLSSCMVQAMGYGSPGAPPTP
jgi:hypothetical protein